MGYSNLLELIHQGNSFKNGYERIKGKLNNYSYFGRIIAEAEEDSIPGYLKRLEKVDRSDIWVVFTLMGTGASKDVAKNRDNTDFAYGNIFVLAPKSIPLGDWYRIDGVARTVLFDGTGNSCYISGMQKVGDKWCVSQPTIRDLDLVEVSRTMEKYILKSEEYSVFFQPEMPKGFKPLVAYTSSKLEKSITPESKGIAILEQENNTQETNKENKTNKIEEKSTVNDFSMEIFEGEAVNESENENIDENENDNENVNSGKLDVVVTDKPSDSIEWREVRYRSREKQVVENRKFRAQKSKKAAILAELAFNANSVRDKTLKEISRNFDIVNDDIYSHDKKVFLELLNSIKNNTSRKPEGVGLTGDAIIKEFVNKQPDSKMAYKNTTLGVAILEHGTGYICDYLAKPITGKRIQFNIELKDRITAGMVNIFALDIQSDFAVIYAILLGLDVRVMRETAQACVDAKISFIKLVEENPYMLILINSSISFVTLETLANARGIKSETSWRLISILHETLLSGNGSTVFSIYDIYRNSLTYSIGKRGLERVRVGSSLINAESKSNLKAYIDHSLNERSWYYDSYAFDTNGSARLSKDELQSAIKEYVDVGLGVVYKGFIYNTQMLSRELYIYDRIYTSAITDKYIDMSTIEDSIKEIESKNGYTLEKEQADAVRMIDQLVLCVTGPAGSGKTTTVEAMRYALERAANISLEDIVYAAPTGKAAKRLQEVVGSLVKTEHSLFVVGNNAAGELNRNSEDGNLLDAKVLILDEQAMADVNLMYNALKRVKKFTRIWLLGDKEQLVPIGDGKPFADFLRFLPTVALRVSKRASAKSHINLNAKNIIENSEKGNFISLINGPDFRLRPCGDEAIVKTVLDICAYHLDKISLRPEEVVSNIGILPEQDIQVISPIVTKKYSWGCDNMNVLLQDLFNPEQFRHNSTVTYGFENNLKSIRVGSKVVHTVNNYNKRQYRSVAGGRLEMTNIAGIMNGDVGYVVAIFDGNECKEIKPKDVSYEYNGKDIEDLERCFNSEYAIIAVKYYDASIREYYYILYTGYKSYANSTDSNIFVTYTDLDQIQLAYALSVHKMQGSQEKLIIYVVGSKAKPFFVNRNMTYTGITRASEAVYCVGSISTMEKGREYEGSSARNTVLSELYEND